MNDEEHVQITFHTCASLPPDKKHGEPNSSSPFLSRRRESTVVEVEAAVAAAATTVTKEFASKWASPLLLDRNCGSGATFSASVSTSFECASKDVLLNASRVSGFPSEEDDRQSLLPCKSSQF